MCNEEDIIKQQHKLLSGRQMFDVELTTACNKQCYICPRDKMTRVGQNMSLAIFDILCNWLPKDCDVFFAGMGEPLLHKSCAEFVKKLHLSGRKTSIMTNARLLSEAKLSELFSVGLDKLQISIIYKTDMSLIPNYLSIIADNNKNNVVFNIIKDVNTEISKRELDFFQEKGLRYCIKQVHNRAGHLYTADNNMDLHTCATFFCDTFISANGEIFVCSNDINGRHSIDNIQNISFLELLEYKKKFIGNKQICSLCLQCTDEYREKHFNKN